MTDKDKENIKISTDNLYNWQDITKQFEELCSQLHIGELVHDSNFGLFEAMSAIEMMDPKMDAGMLCNQVNRKVYDFMEASNAGILKINNLEKRELIAIIDNTFACLSTWLEGHSLAQTVFTNLYLHEPFQINDKILKSFSIGILKIVDLARDQINKANVFEEEDFQAMSYGFKFADEITSAKALNLLKEVDDDVAKSVRNTKERPDEQYTIERSKDHDLNIALHSRIRFSRFFYATLLAFQKEKCAGIEDILKYSNFLIESLSIMKNTFNLGIKPIARECGLHDYPTVMGFEPLVNQRLLPSTFPRYTKIISINDTMEYLIGVCKRLRDITNVVKLTNLHNALDFIEEFSKLSPCVLSRSLLQLTVFPTNRMYFGKEPLIDTIRETIRNFIAPPALVPKSTIYGNSDVKMYCDAFLQRSVNIIFQLSNIYGQNRARQREKLGHIFEDLANLLVEGDKLDTFLHRLLIKNSQGQPVVCFVTWLLYHILKAMFHYLFLGFELELYAEHEFYYIYWYISELHCSWWIPTLSRADTFLLESEAMIQTDSGKTAKKIRRQQKKKGKPHQQEILLAQVHQILCNAFLKALLGFINAKKLITNKEGTSIAFDSEEVRFRRRFSLFQVLSSPNPLSYGHFLDTIDLQRYNPIPEPEHLFQAACKGFQHAKNLIDDMGPAKQTNNEINLLRVCRVNMVAMNVLSTGEKKYEKPIFDFTIHKHYPIITLKN